jgi:hypothetical protein
MFCILLLYGADTIYSQVNKKAFSKRIREQLDGTVKELSAECGLSEERINKILEKRYGKSRLRILIQSSLSFLTPSKHQNNSPILIGERIIDSELISEVPTEAEIEGADVPEIARQFRDVLVELHAQDVDRSKQGWAAVIPEISPKRLRMEINPPIKPEQIYTKQKIRADVMLVSHKKPDGKYQPHVFHLLDVKGGE